MLKSSRFTIFRNIECTDAKVVSFGRMNV